MSQLHPGGKNKTAPQLGYSGQSQDVQEAFSVGLHVPLQGLRNPPTHNQPTTRLTEGAGFSANRQHRQFGVPSFRSPCSARCLDRAEDLTLFPRLIFHASVATSPQLLSGMCFPKVIVLAKEELRVTGQAAALWPPRERASAPHPADGKIPRAHHRLVSLRVNARIL